MRAQISLLVNFSFELGQTMIRYGFLLARTVILNNVRTDFWSTFHVNWENNDQILLHMDPSNYVEPTPNLYVRLDK